MPLQLKPKIEPPNSMPRRSAIPLILGTFFLRVNTGAGGIVLGLFLASLALQAGHPITSIQVGLLSVAYFIAELTLAPFMGALSDRWGRRLFMIVGPLLGVLHISLVPFAPIADPLPYLLSLQVLSGLASAMMVPAVLGYLADFTRHNPTIRVRMMSFYELATSGGIAVGVVLGGFAWDRFNRWAFGMLALFYLIAVCCMVLVPKVQQISQHGNLPVLARRYWRIVRTPRLFIFIPAWLCINALIGIWLSSQLTFILSSHRHVPQQLLVGIMSGPGGGSHLSLVLGAYVLFFGLCLLFWAFFLNRVPRLLLMLFSIAGVYLSCVALAGINHSTGDSLSLGAWIPFLLLGIFAESSFAPSALAYLADISEGAAQDRGLLMGLYSVFLGLGQTLGNGLGGVFAHRWSFDGLIYLTAILACIALVSLLVLFWQERRMARLHSEIHQPSEVAS